VTDAAQVGKAFSLVVGLAAPDVVMDPLATSLVITVQSGQAVASSSMPSWELRLIILGSSLATAALAAFALNHLLQGKADPKTVEAMQQGDTNVNNATGGDPKSTSQTVLRNENDTLPIIIRNITPLESEISGVIKKQEALNGSIDETQQIIYKLDEYLAEHRDDDPEAPVEDPYIRDELKLQTFGEVTSGMVDLMSLNFRRRNELSDLMGYGNALQATITSHQNNVDNASSSESNDERLLADE
jgi:hypothetical protein